MKYLIAIPCAFVLATWAALSFAADERVLSTARELSEQGMADYEAGRYDAAAEKLQQVYATVPLPSSARNAARAIAKQGRLLKAAQLLLECTRMQPNELWRADLQQTAQSECEQERSQVLARVARLSVVVHGASHSEVDISLDNIPVPAALNSVEQHLDPGMHHVVAVRGAQTVEREFQLSEGQHMQVELTFEPSVVSPAPALLAPPAPAATATHTQAPRNSQRKTWAIVSGAVGVVGLGVGTAMVLLAEHTYNNAQCGEDNRCSRPGYDDRARAIHTANWSMVPFAIGLAGVGTGVALWFIKPASSNDERPRAGLLLAPNQLSVHGQF